MSIVNNLTISGFKILGSDCDGSDFINTDISSSNIYTYQAAAIASSLSQTIYLANGSARGGAKTVDTLSVMVNTADPTDRVEINGYVATRGVGSGGSTAGGYVINWAVWASQSTGSGGVPSSTAYGNTPAYFLTSGSGGSYSLNQVKIAATYNTNNSLSVTEGSNTLIIEIWNAARTTKKATLTYYVVIVSSSTRLSSLIPTLSPSVIVPGYSYSPAFDSDYCSYNSQIYILNVDPSATSMTLTPTTTVSGNGAVISITTPSGSVLAPLLSGQTSSSFAIADNDSVNVSVTAPDGTTVQQYVLSIQSDVSGNDLSGAVFSYYNTPSTTLPFDATAPAWLNSINPSSPNLLTNTQFSYLNTIFNATYGLSVTLTAVDSGSSVAVGSATPVVGSGTFLIPYSSLVQGAQNVIVCSCISSTGVVKLYNFNIWLAGSDLVNAAALANISFNSSQAVIDPSNPFTSSNIFTASSLAGITIGSTGLPIYTVYVAASSTYTPLVVNLTYTDNGSRFSTNQVSTLQPNPILAPTGWIPTTPDANLNANTTTDNWTLGSLRTVTKNINVGVLTPGTTEYLLVASHLPGSSLYYGYALEFVTPKANLSALSLASYETGAPITLNPSFSSLVESYTAYIGTAANPTNYVNLTTLFGSGIVADWSITDPGTGVGATPYNASNALTSGSPLTINLGALASSYILYVRLWNASSTGTQYAYYTLNLLNVDQSLLLSGLTVYQQVAPSSSTGLYPVPTTTTALSPLFASGTFVYNTPVPSLYASIRPQVNNPGVKTIRISLNGATPVVVISGSYFNFPMNAREIAAEITVTDNLSPANSNSYLVFIYSNSNDLSLSLANFSGILNSSFSPALPDGVTVTAPLTVTSGGSTSVTCTNAPVSSTTFTGTPRQAGTSMYLSTPVGFEPLAPGVASSVISLIPNSAVTIPVWMYANNNTSTGTFNFVITQLPDTNSYLSSMLLSNCSNFVFNPTTQTYTGIILVAPNTSFTFTPTTASTNATMTYTFNGSSSASVISGASVNLTSTNFLPSTNLLSIFVAPQSGPIRTYTFTIVRDANYYLSNLRVYDNLTAAQTSTSSTLTGVAINPSPFSATFYTYSAEVVATVDTAYVVLSKSPESSITMTNATSKGLNLSGEQVWAVPVQVTTTPQNTLVYSINPSAITVSYGVQSSVYNLAIVRQYPIATMQSFSLSTGGVTIPLRNQLGVPTTFDPLVFTYTISPVFSGSVDVSIVGQGYNTYYLNGSPYYVPVSVVIDGSHPIVVRVVNNDGSSSLYQVSLL